MGNSQIEKAVKAFKEGKVVIFPTDTAYGIGCRMDNVSTVKKIYSIRKRQESKPFLVLVSGMEMARQYVGFDEKASKFLKKQWPGGVTLILPCKKDLVPGIVRAGGETLAVRIPNHEELLEIIKEVGVPIIAPSANIAGDPTPYSLGEVNNKLLDLADYVMAGECAYGKESTIIDATVDPWEVVREGAVKVDL